MTRSLNNSRNKSLGITISRIIISLIIFKDLVIYLANAESLFGEAAIVPYQTYTNILSYYGVDVLTFPFDNNLATYLFLVCSILICLLFLLGVSKKITGITLFLCLWELKNRNIYIMDGADNVIWVMLPFLAFANSFDIFAQGKPEKAGTRLMDHISLLAAKGIAIQLCFIYFFTALSKSMHDTWQNGTAIYYILRMEDFRSTPLNVILTQSGFLVMFLTYFTLLFEFSFPFLIWFKKIKKFAALTGILLHLGIFILMRIDNFSFVIISFYPALFDDAEIKKYTVELADKIYGIGRAWITTAAIRLERSGI